MKGPVEQEQLSADLSRKIRTAEKERDTMEALRNRNMKTGIDLELPRAYLETLACLGRTSCWRLT